MTAPVNGTVFEHKMSIRANFVPHVPKAGQKGPQAEADKKSPNLPRDCKTVRRAV